MIKIIYSFLISLIFIIFSPISAYSQNPAREEYSKIFENYLIKYEEYTASHELYTLSKKQYEQYQTLSAKEKLQKDLSDMLKKRDLVLVYYYNAVASKLDDGVIVVSDEIRNEYKQKLAGEVLWLNEHMSSYQATSSPEQLSLKSAETQTRYNDFSGNLHRCLYYIARGKLDYYNNRFNYLYNDLYSLSEKIKNEQREAYMLSDAKIEIIYRWFGEIELKNTEFQDVVTQADNSIVKASGKNSLSVYNNGIKLVNDAKIILLTKIAHANEVAREIKVSEN